MNEWADREAISAEAYRRLEQTGKTEKLRYGLHLIWKTLLRGRSGKIRLLHGPGAMVTILTSPWNFRKPLKEIGIKSD